MRAAPAADLPLAPGRRERALMVLVHAAACCALAAWLASWHWPEGPRAPLACLMVASAVLGALAGAWQAARLLPPVARTLRWTGQAWLLGNDPSPVWQVLSDLQLQLDLGDWLLLRGLTDRGSVVWAVASRRHGGPAWHAMAVALHAHTGQGLPRPAEPAGP